MNGGDTPFQNIFEDIDHGVVGRHGHEFDKFNYEDYMRRPIGDPITTELIAKFPCTVMNNQIVKNLPAPQQSALKRNLQDIENVRPLSATIEWLLYQVKSNVAIKEVIEDGVDQAIKDFNNLRFVKKWYEHHDRWTDWWDEVDKIQAVLFLLEKFKLFPSEKLLPLVDKVKRFAKDENLSRAVKEYLHRDNRTSPRLSLYRAWFSPCRGYPSLFLVPYLGSWYTKYLPHRSTLDKEA